MCKVSFDITYLQIKFICLGYRLINELFDLYDNIRFILYDSSTINNLSGIIFNCFESFDCDTGPLFWNGSLYMHEAFISDVISSEAEDHALDDSSGTSQEVRIGPSFVLCKNSKWLPQIFLIRLFKVVISLIGVAKSTVEQSEDGIGHGRRALVRYFGLVVCKISRNLLNILDNFQRICQ